MVWMSRLRLSPRSRLRRRWLRQLHRTPRRRRFTGAGVSSEPPHDRPGPAAGRSSDWYKLRGVRRLLGKALFAIDPVEVKARLGNLEERVESEARFARALQRAVELVRDERVPAVEARLDAAETVLRDLQGILETMRDQRLPG